LNKTQEFIDRAFSGPPDEGVKCPCSRCRNTLCEDKRTLTLHLCKFGFMPNYEVWTHHGDTIHQRTASLAEEEENRSGVDRMDEMLDAIRPELETHPKDPPTPEVQKFFDMLRALEELLHELTTISVLAFVTRLMSIKSKFALSNKCYKELLSIFSDVLPSNHKMLKDMYQSKVHNWTHRYALWELPYAKALILMHNIDVMHQERNVGESILSTCMAFTDKIKDNYKTKKDLAQLCNQPSLELKSSGGKPCAPFCLKPKEKKEVSIWLKNLKFPDGYTASFRRAANLESGKVSAVKSHDYHIFMERLLPVMFRGYLDDDVWTVLN
jgi:hypothetical protein